MFQVQLEEVRRAHRALRPLVRETPLLPSEFSDQVYFKAESLQRTGSFKIRTALNQLLHLGERERQRGVVASSSGNFAQGVALAAKSLGVDATIVMMRTANPLKVQRTREYGARVVFCEPRFEARQAEVDRLRDEEGLTEVHPFDHPNGIVGNATIGLEIARQLPEVRHLVAPISGGGLIAGVAAGLRLCKPEVRVWGVQPERSDATFRSFREGRPVTIQEPDTLADGLKVIRPGQLTFPLIRQHVHDVVTVSEDSILEAVRLLLWKERLVVEPSGAVPLAALLGGQVPAEQTVLVSSGGNIAPDVLRQVATPG